LILYVNGDSHTAAAEAVNPHVFACDDGDAEHWRLGRRPHPDNDRVSWGFGLANLIGSTYINDSESASSNHRIMRTARTWIESNPAAWSDLLVIIQWSTWEREEWLIDDEYYQINASGIDQVPDRLSSTISAVHRGGGLGTMHTTLAQRDLAVSSTAQDTGACGMCFSTATANLARHEST
jgi:hypothetical protein